jgi:hypothetical protein
VVGSFTSGRRGYRSVMPRPHGEERPVEAEGVPAEEQMPAADVSERVHEDPEEQENFTERHPEAAGDDPDDQ